jgi:Flp pilus assembly protein TadG
MTMKMTSRKRSRFAREDGQSIVEFAFIMPFLVLLLVAICQFGLAFRNYLAITDAARVGARKAAVSRTLTGGPCQAARDAIQATVSSTQWSVVSSRITCTPSTPGATGTSFTISINYPVTIGLPQIFGLPRIAVSGTMTAAATERLE